MNLRLFDKEVYIRRRGALKKMTGSGIILLLGNEESGMNYKDNWYPFRQDSSFLYYFGLNVAGLAAVIDTESGDEIIFGNESSINDIIWTGPLPTVAEMGHAVGVSATQPYNSIVTFIQEGISSKREIHFLPPYRPENRQKLSEWLNEPVGKINSLASGKLIHAIISQRSYKEPCEVEELIKAAQISEEMHLAAMRFAQPGKKEFEIISRLKGAAFSRNAGLSFNPIVTIHGETLHNTYSGNTVKDGEIILCDAGASCDMQYAGDLTTTFPAGSKFTSQQKELYEIVLSAQEHAVSLLKPGVTFKSIHLQACEELAKGLKQIGLMKGDTKEAVAAGAHTLFFQCGLGHMIGLDVHDMEDFGEEHVGYNGSVKKDNRFGLKSLRLGRELEKGFTLTIEPGLYFIPSLLDKWESEGKLGQFINYDKLEQYRNSRGIRIEEDYLITEYGSIRLGRGLPKTIDEVENIRRAFS